MFQGQKVVVVMPAYNAARTLRQTYQEVMAQGVVDHIIVVDDASKDDTVEVARGLDGVRVHVHPANQGYGGNQKTCYRLALEEGGRHRHHGPPGLPVHAAAAPGAWCPSSATASTPASSARASSAAAP